MIEMVLTMLHYSIALEVVFNENGRYDWDDRVSLEKKLFSVLLNESNVRGNKLVELPLGIFDALTELKKL